MGYVILWSVEREGGKRWATRARGVRGRHSGGQSIYRELDHHNG